MLSAFLSCSCLILEIGWGWYAGTRVTFLSLLIHPQIFLTLCTLLVWIWAGLLAELPQITVHHCLRHCLSTGRAWKWSLQTWGGPAARGCPMDLQVLQFWGTGIGICFPSMGRDQCPAMVLQAVLRNASTWRRPWKAGQISQTELKH